MKRVAFVISVLMALCFSVVAFGADAPTKQNINSTTTAVTDTRVPIRVYGDTITASQCITNDRVIIKQIYWAQPVTVADDLVITDRAGNYLFDSYCVVAYQGQMVQNVRIPANGIYITLLDSGSVYFYLENE